MQISEAREYIGRNCHITWRDRSGREQTTVLRVNDLTFVPLYGTYLVGDSEELNLERVTSIQVMD